MRVRTQLAIRITWPFFLLVPCLPLPLLAQTQPGAPSAAETLLKKPTSFRTRAEVREEYQDLGDGAYRNIVSPRFEYAVSPSVALRIDTPYVTYNPGAGGESVSGQGDLVTRGVWRTIERDGFALNVGTEVIFNTAEKKQLGFGKTVVAPFMYAAIDLPKHDSVFFPNIQQYNSVAGDSNRSDVNFTTVKPNLLTRWPNKVYTFLEPQFTVDWERNATVGLTVELEAGKILSNNIAAWLRPGVGVINRGELPQVYDWNIEVGMRYIF